MSLSLLSIWCYRCTNHKIVQSIWELWCCWEFSDRWKVSLQKKCIIFFLVDLLCCMWPAGYFAQIPNTSCTQSTSTKIFHKAGTRLWVINHLTITLSSSECYLYSLLMHFHAHHKKRQHLKKGQYLTTSALQGKYIWMKLTSQSKPLFTSFNPWFSSCVYEKWK